MALLFTVILERSMALVLDGVRFWKQDAQLCTPPEEYQ
jgi:hypothetical protein